MLKEEGGGGQFPLPPPLHPSQQQPPPPPIGHVFFSGLNEPCAVDSIVEIVVNTTTSSGNEETINSGNVQIYVTSPQGLKRNCEVIHRGNAFTTTFTPERIGKWLIGILYEGSHIEGSPFNCFVFDAGLVHVSGLDVGLVGHELKFTIDAARAGKGNIKVLSSINGRLIDTLIIEEPPNSGVYRAKLEPKGPGKYKIQIDFNNRPVNGSPFILDIAGTDDGNGGNLISVYGDQLQMATVGKLANFFIHAPNIELKQISSILTTPSGIKRHGNILPLDGTTFKVEWNPNETGEHLIDIFIFDRPIPENPFSCQVGDPELVSVKRMPQQIENRNLNKPHAFEIDATAAGSGNLEIIINNGRVACRVHETTSRHFIAEFTPIQEIRHIVEMKFNGEHVRDSPWSIPFISTLEGLSTIKEQNLVSQQLRANEKEDIITELIGSGLDRSIVGELSYFDIRSNIRLRTTNVSVKIVDIETGYPIENIFLIERGPGTVRCEYTLNKVGDYEVFVYIDERLIDVNQLIISAFNPKNIFVKLQGIEEDYIIGKPIYFIVDASEAGKGQLEISVNQGQVPNNVQMQDAGRCLVTFIPQHAGTYVIDVTFNGLQVHGCPIKVDVRERQVGKPVSAPVYAHPTTTSNISPSPTRGPSSSAYFSSTSPHAAASPSYTAAAASPSSTPPQIPRSPPLVAGVEAALLGGYTVAQYGNGGGGSGIPPIKPKTISSPLSTPPTTRQKPKLFEEKEIPIINRPSIPESAQLEMTRSAEMTLFRDIPKTLVTTPIEEKEGKGREIPIQHSFNKISDQKSKELIKITNKAYDLPYAPLDQNIKKTLELIQKKQKIENIREKEETIITREQQYISSSAISPISTESISTQQIQTHIVDPYSSDIEAMTPGTRRRLLEHSVYRASDLKETPTDHEESETAISSKQSSKATTPKLSLKFRGSKDKVSSIIHPTTTMTTTTTTATISGANDIFDWGKSKINSKHEVVRRGKEVDVRIDSLKLGKEDQLYIIVLPPGIVVRPNELPTSEQSLPHKLKKSGTKNWEINFRPSVVGTHKVYIFVNTIPHPQSPFPIRVYDASQIVVGDIVRQSVVNDTVEFTVDAGRAGFGNLEMAIKDNEGIIIPSHVSQLEAGAAKFLVTFTPNLPGTHTVHITFNKEVINGSPFEVNIVEHPIVGQDSQISKKKKKDKKSKEKHSLNGTQKSIETTTSTQQQQLTNNKPMVSKLPSLSRVGQPVELLVNLVRSDDLVQAQIYDLDKELLNVEIIPDISNNNCKLIFIPKRVGDHEVEIRVAGTEIEGSPFTCRIYDPTKILVGEIPNGSINKPVSFVVDASQAGVGNLEVAVNEGKIPSMAYALGQHKYEITFIPKEEIDHRISVRFNNEYVPGSPFICRLTNSLQQQQQPLQQKQLSPPIKHRQFGASGPGLERIPVGQPTEFFVDVKPEGGETKTFDLLPRVQIMDPRGELLPIDVAAYEEEPTRSIVRYTPKSVGNHQIFIKLNNQQIPGSPFTAKVFDASCVKLALEGEGGQVGRPCAFTIDAAKAGAGNMEIIVSVDKRNVPNYVQPEGQARFRVTFTPQEAIEHLINVNFNGIPVPGSPLYCPIQPSSSIQRSSRHINNSDSEQQLPIQKQELLVIQPPTSIESKDEEEKEEKELKLVGDLSNAIIDEPKRFSIDTPTNIGRKVECNVIVVDPQGSPLPVRCYKQQDDSYWVEFTPEHCGPHRIEITFGDEPLVGSPFLCEVIDPKKVYVHGIDRPFSLRTLSNFIIDRKTAGDGTLNVELIDPQNESLKLDKIKNSVGDDSFTFLPTRLGIHRLSVRLAGFSIPSSPFQIIVEEQKTSPTVYGAALDYAIEKSQQASMIFDANKQPGGLKIDIKSPSDEKVRYTTNRRPDETTEIAFRPQEVGIYKVNIEFNNRIVNGSPFNVLVIDPTKILIIPSDDQRKNTRQDGMIQLNVGQQNIIELDATNAGPAKIKAEVRDADGELLPNKQQIQVQPSNNGNYQLLFNPRKIGKYKIYLYCSELVVPNAYPLLVYAEQILTKIQTEIPEMNGERQRKYKEVIEEVIDNEIIEKKELLINGNVKLRGSGLTTARIKEQSEFIIDASELKKELMGKCTATLLGDRADIPIKLSALGNQIFKGIYTPLVEGKYQLSVKIDGNHVPGSPSTVNVKAPEISPSQLIEVDGRPLKMGILGEDMQTLIDARKAGPGQISAQCSGLSQLEYCELLDNGDGTYMLRIQPKELGKHTLSVKYDNEHVKESPFTFNVNHPPDPSKVKVYGPGIEHGILHSFNSNFVVETKGAGAGQLTVRVRGPKGAFNVEMQRDREQERTIHCKYEPREPGDYQVEVKWHGQHVPGSPFFVLIVDTEQELHRFLAGGIPSPTPTSPFVPPGWLPPGPPGIIPGPIPGGAPPMPIMSSPMPPPHFIKGNRISPGGIPPPPPTHSIFQQQQYVRGYGQQHPPQHPHQPIYGKPHY